MNSGWSNIKSKNQEQNYTSIDKRVQFHDEYENDSRVVESVKNMMESVFDSEYETNKRDEFRVSSFPYCPVIDLYQYFDSSPETVDYGTDFYTNLGTAVHETIQHHKSISYNKKLVIGFWRCKLCNLVFNEKPIPKPSKIKQKKSCLNSGPCTGTLEHEEIEFKYKNLSGHIDNLTILPKPVKKRVYCAFEYKTCSNKYVDDMYYRNFLPFPKHPHQVKTYCALLYKLFNIKPSYYAIVYIARDKPFYNNKINCVIVLRKITKSEINRILKHLDISSKAREYVQDFKKTKSKNSLKEILKLKPCQKPNDYLNNGMDDKFFGREKCPFFKDGSCFDGRIKKHIQNKIKE